MCGCSKHSKHNKIDTLSVQYYDLELKTQDQLQTLEIYQITNNTYEDYYTWITEKPIGNQTETEVIASSFLRKGCDFCPFLYYLVSTRVRQPDILGLTFYKKIKKGQTFSYIITMENNHLNTYKDRIVIMKAEDLHGSHHLIPDEELMERYSYELPYIVLHGE